MCHVIIIAVITVLITIVYECFAEALAATKQGDPSQVSLSTKGACLT